VSVEAVATSDIVESRQESIVIWRNADAIETEKDACESEETEENASSRDFNRIEGVNVAWAAAARFGR
jgi:hypothetical protein